MNIKLVYRHIFAIVLLLGMMLFLAPGAEASEYGDEQEIFEFMTQEMGLPPASACGIMANMEAESSFRLVCYGDEGTSFGLCQWHAGRFDALKAFCGSRGYDYRTLEGQLNFLLFDLRVNFPDTYKHLRCIPNDSQGAYDAAYYWCVNYERPAGMQAAGAHRGRIAQMKYWNRFGRYAPGTGGTVVDSNGLSGLVSSSSVWESLFYWEKHDTAEEEAKTELPKTETPRTEVREPVPKKGTEEVVAETAAPVASAEETETAQNGKNTEETEPQELCERLMPQHPPVIPLAKGKLLSEETVLECSCGEVQLQFNSKAPVVTYEIS